MYLTGRRLFAGERDRNAPDLARKQRAYLRRRQRRRLIGPLQQRISELALLPMQVHDPRLDGARRDEAIHRDGTRLTNAVCAVRLRRVSSASTCTGPAGSCRPSSASRAPHQACLWTGRVGEPSRRGHLLPRCLAPSQPAQRHPRESKQHRACLRALSFLGQERRFASERLGAAAILAQRLAIPPKGGRLAVQLAEACNLFGSEAHADRAALSLPADARARLARAGDALFARSATPG